MCQVLGAESHKLQLLSGQGTGRGGVSDSIPLMAEGVEEVL